MQLDNETAKLEVTGLGTNGQNLTYNLPLHRDSSFTTLHLSFDETNTFFSNPQYDLGVIYVLRRKRLH